jgi:hypothetical protein
MFPARTSFPLLEMKSMIFRKRERVFCPQLSLTEAIRVTYQGVALVVLNRWSLGGLSRL